LQFYIPATSSLQERQPRTLKQGDTFGLFDHYGDIVPGPGSPDGLYHRDTRFLSGLQHLGDSRFDVMLRRYGNEVSVNLLDRQGDGRVAVSL